MATDESVSGPTAHRQGPAPVHQRPRQPAEQIAAPYKQRWQLELFFKWIKQNLKITRFIGTGENAIRSDNRLRHTSC